MFATRTLFSGVALLATVVGFSTTADAQLFGLFGRGCYPYYGPPAYYGAPAYGPVSYAPSIQTASVSDCPCMKPVTETVYKEVDVVKYREVPKTTQVAKVVTVMEERPVTTYQTINEVKTVDVPTYVNQTVTEMRPVTQNNSYWRTNWQPVPKMSPCLYDGRPGLVGELNRLGYAFRNTFTPNAVARREYIPNVTTYNVPVQRTVQVPTTRQVSYNVSRQVPVTTTQKVPVQKTVYEEMTYTAYEAYTEKQTVAVGKQTKMVYVNPTGGATASANEPTPATASQQTAHGKGVLRENSAPKMEKVPVRNPTYQEEYQSVPARRTPEPTPARVPVAEQPQSDSVIKVAGWQATRRSVAKPATSPVLEAPKLVAQQ